jgi:hypothetical protein
VSSFDFRQQEKSTPDAKVVIEVNEEGKRESRCVETVELTLKTLSRLRLRTRGTLLRWVGNLSVGSENGAVSTYSGFDRWGGVGMWTELSTDAMVLVQKPISNRPSPALQTPPEPFNS